MAGNTTSTFTAEKEDISEQVLELINICLLFVLASVVAFTGIVFNVFNIVVFVRQGLGDTVNIGLMGLAVSDLCSLITLEMVCIVMNPLFCETASLVVNEFQHLTAAWPHNCFARISSWITAYIIVQRCLCVVVPLKIKTIITPRLTVSVIVFISVFMFLTLVPDYSTSYMAWKFDRDLNRSSLGLVFLENNEEMAVLTFNLGAGTQLGSFGAVILFTVILVAKMKEKSKWRKSASSHGQDSSKKDISSRDQKTIKMIILVAVIYCACFLPILCANIATSLVPEFIIFGAYNNMFLAFVSLAFLLDGGNSTVNIFVYYRMSTKYRTTFDLLIKQKVNAQK